MDTPKISQRHSHPANTNRRRPPRPKKEKRPKEESNISLCMRHAIEVINSATAAMGVREIFYALVGKNLIENSRQIYKTLSNATVRARKQGLIAWDMITDTLRKPLSVPMWQDLPDFARSVIASYRRDVWATQRYYVEVWLEKETLARKFLPILKPYGITLNVGRGFDGWTSRYEAAQRYLERAKRHERVIVLYYGDFDPSGECMIESLRESLAEFGAYPTIIKKALTFEDIQRYDLPPNPVKEKDSRAKKFIAKYGRECVELDSLEANDAYKGVLLARLKADVEAYLDLDAWRATVEIERQERERLAELLTQL